MPREGERGDLKVFLGFFRGIGTLAPAWWPWIGLLIVVNGIAPLFFLETPEARVTLAAFAIGALVQMVIFRVKGFVRLLGLGHLVVWIPLLVWLWPRLAQCGTGDPFGKWLAVLLVVDGLSVVIDAADVVRYALGERDPSLTVEEL